MTNLKLFYHFCLGGNDPFAIIREQLDYVISSGLVNKLQEVHVVLVSEPISINQLFAFKVEIGEYLTSNAENPPLVYLHNGGQLQNREQATLERLYKHAQRYPEDYYLYIHSKGISYPVGSHVRECVDSWRQLMCNHLILQHENALSVLENCEAVGINLTTTETDGSGSVPRHFSGNYWWAKGKYLASLSNPKDFPKLDIREPEFWVGTGEGKLESLFQSKVNHYREKL